MKRKEKKFTHLCKMIIIKNYMFFFFFVISEKQVNQLNQICNSVHASLLFYLYIVYFFKRTFYFTFPFPKQKLHLTLFISAIGYSGRHLSTFIIIFMLYNDNKEDSAYSRKTENNKAFKESLRNKGSSILVFQLKFGKKY